MRLLPIILRRAVRVGRLTIIDHLGQQETYGGQAPGPDVTLRFTDPGLARRIAMEPELGVAEGYMDGALVIEQGTLWNLFEIYFLNKPQFLSAPTGFLNVHKWWRHWRKLDLNPRGRAKQNVARHYDLGNGFYRSWLDRDMQYSCAYFEDPGQSLEAAQTAKKRHIAAKLCLEPGQRVLDIGCGWGGMALYLAAVADVEVLGITLAEEQLAVARARAEAAGLSHKVRFELRDYRDVRETFDRVVSVGMLEHVGPAALEAYFAQVRNCLEPRGIALIHSITANNTPRQTSPFLRKYIFPGGSIPGMSDALSAVQEAGLWTLDMELLRLHYARTLEAWWDNFQTVKDQVHAEYGAEFVRMWEFYLTACRFTFSHGQTMVFQLQLGLDRDAAPLTRDYIADAEAALREREGPVLERLLASSAAAIDGDTPVWEEPAAARAAE